MDRRPGSENAGGEEAKGIHVEYGMVFANEGVLQQLPEFPH